LGCPVIALDGVIHCKNELTHLFPRHSPALTAPVPLRFEVPNPGGVSGVSRDVVVP
jgi:hypothetical protein